MSPNSHKVVESGEFVVFVAVWIDDEKAFNKIGPMVEDLAGSGRKSCFTMHAEVIWRLDEFDKQEEEKEGKEKGREVLSLQEGRAWQRSEICGVTEVDGQANKLGVGLQKG